MRAAFKKLALLQLLKNKNVITKTLKDVKNYSFGEESDINKNSEKQQQRNLWKSADCLKS